MISHEIDFLCIFIKIDGFATPRIAAGAGLFILMGPLRGIIFGVNIKYFILLRGVSGAIQKACLFSSGQRITWMAYIFCLALANAAILGVST